MKAFRGTFLAILALAVTLGAWFLLRPPPPVTPAKDKKAPEGTELFAFEKQDLVKVEVERPGSRIVLVEKPDGWWLEGEDFRAARNMVNKFKHQLHDLTSRATVVDDPQELALYGLGDNAVHVTLHFRDGETKQFDAGDPNPSGVSFYIRPLPGDVVYTVKKSAVDFYTLSLDEFRERRFAGFDSKDVDVVEAARADGVTLRFQRTGPHDWEMTSPETFLASDDKVRQLMGRVSAMKAIQFVADGVKDPARYGLDHPRLLVTLRFSGREPLSLAVGAPTGEKDGEYALAYARLGDEDTVYAVRDGILEEYAQEPRAFRLTRFVRIDGNRVTRMTATWKDRGRDADLNGTVVVTMAADVWMWEDGVPVPGSTPKRVASRATGVEARSWIGADADAPRYGFADPRATVRLEDLDGVVRTLVVGAAAPSEKDPEGHEQERWYARLAEAPDVYVIDDGVVEVLRDLFHEHRRKAKNDDAAAERHDKIEEEIGAPLPGRRPSDPPSPPGAP